MENYFSEKIVIVVIRDAIYYHLLSRLRVIGKGKDETIYVKKWSVINQRVSIIGASISMTAIRLIE